MTTDPVEILNQRNAEVAKIRGYADLTEEAKQSRIADVSERARAEYEETRETQKRDREQRLEQSKGAVFRIPIPLGTSEGEAAQIRGSYRSARSDIESAIAPSVGEDQDYTQRELERFLEQAELTGDSELARAAYHVAIRYGIQSVVDAYLQKRPAESKAWQRYTEAAQEAQEAQGIGAILERSLTDRAFSQES